MMIRVLIGILFITSTLSAPLQLESISTFADSIPSSLSGSTKGGTTLYIKGSGFDPDPTKNQVFVGSFPCDIPAQGVVDTTLSCITTDSGSDSSSTHNVKVIVDGQSRNAPKTFSYKASDTPEMTGVFPSTSFPGDRIYFTGRHRVLDWGNGERDTGDFIGVFIGTQQCSLFDITQNDLHYSNIRTMKCDSSTEQPAGKYNVKTHVRAGYSKSDYKLQKTSEDAASYEHTILAKINSVSPQTVFTGGSSLTISGAGFSTSMSQNTVTVDGVTCDVTAATSTQIKCDLQAKTTQSALISTNGSSQVNGYIKGAGFDYARYSTSTMTTKTANGLKSQHSGMTPVETGVRAQLESINIHGSNYGQTWKGYFKAEYSGVYTFMGSADDSFSFFISDDYGTASIPATPLISSTSQTSDADNIHIANYSTQSAPKTLQAGKYYWVELYHVNTASSGYVKIHVSGPNPNSKTPWQTHEVNQINTAFTNEEQIRTFTLSNAIAGTFKLWLRRQDPKTLKTTYQKQVQIAFDASESAFTSALKQFDIYSSYGLTTTVATSGNTRTWTVSIYHLRATSHFEDLSITKTGLTADNNTEIEWTQVQTRAHCPLITGTFTINAGGVAIALYDSSAGTYSNTDIPYDVSEGNLQTAFRQIVGFEKVEVVRKSYPSYGATWIISYIGYNQDVPTLVVSAAGLSGGQSGTNPTIQQKQTRKYSSHLLYSPVNEHFMYGASSGPTVLVTVNDLISACTGSCLMTFQTSVPEILTQSLAGNTLSLTVSDPQTQNFPLADLTVTLDGQACGSLTGTFASFSCTLPQNSDNTPIIRTGDHHTLLNVKDHGVVLPANGVAAISQTLSLDTLTPNNGPANGGTSITIAGTGFPLDKAAITSLTLCSVSPTITAINNIQITISTPECGVTGAQDISMTYAGQTQTISYTYNAAATGAQITSISPTSASPVLKAVMTIAGSGFGTDSSAIEIHLTNSTGKMYEMRVVTITDTQIQCGIPGGLSGNFEVQVNKNGFGNIPAVPNTANDFVYEVTIDGIAPTTGSYYGGTLITITGKNFVDNTQQSLVHMGNQLNWLCSVESITTTQIMCRTPTYHTDWSSSVQNLLVNSRLIHDSDCSSSCAFTYLAQNDAMALTSFDTSNGKPSHTRTITGANLDMSGSALVVVFENKLTSQVTQVTPTTTTATTVEFNVPAVQDGSYNVRTRVDPNGQSNNLLFKVNSEVDSASMDFSVQGGNLAITGRALPSSWPSPLFSLALSTNSISVDADVVSATSTQLTLRLPPGTDGQQYSIVLQTPNQNQHTVTVTQRSSATPKLSLETPSGAVASGSTAITLNRTAVSTGVNPSAIKLYNTLDPDTIVATVTHTESGTELTFTQTLKAGKYAFLVEYDTLGNGQITDNLLVTPTTPFAAANVQTSYVGGILTVAGNDISPQATITVAGMTGKVKETRATQTDFEIPALITADVISTFPELETKATVIPAAIISDGGSNKEYVNDKSYTTYYSSTSATCYVGIDVGAGKKVKISSIRYMPYLKWLIASQYLQDAVIQASDSENSGYVAIHTVDQTVHAGWNSYTPTTTTPYRYVRIRHTTTSNCKLAEFEVLGTVFSDTAVTIASTTVDAMFDDGHNTQTFTNAVEYRQDKTPVVDTARNAMNMPNGDVFGSYDITISGTNLDVGTPKIMIDGVQCVVQTTGATTITCTVGSRLALPAQNEFSVTLGGKNALVKQNFEYVLRWSDIRTWGTDMPPEEGDLVYVPKGMSLFVDQTTPKLEGIIVEEGKLIFADEADMEIHAGLITVNKGQFRAGTQASPYQNKLTFVMYGDYYGKQLPTVGNKGITCIKCKFSMHGQIRTKTWTTLGATVSIGDTALTVQDTTNWKVGDKIVVTSTSFDHNDAETKIITAITGTSITVDSAFTKSHLGQTETFGTATLEMKAEVGLLTRNIKMMGDQTSVEKEYGSHLMMVGSAAEGMRSHVAYTQFTHCGQPQIVGRYCIHFHMNGDVPDSYVKGNAVHESFARILTLHGIHYLHVSYNVGYRVKGHNFFLEDGIETNNVIEYNLAISSLETFKMMQTDISVASFWITNPLNHVRYNRAAGGDFYAFWYQIKPHPDGPSATSDICPQGSPMGESHHNTAHSYVRFGLRIFVLVPRKFPCSPISVNEDDPSQSANPSVNSVFNDFTTYKIGQAGLLAEETGDMIFRNFVIADSGHAGMEFYRTIRTLNEVRAENMVIIGQTHKNPSPGGETDNAMGVIGPRSTKRQWRIKDVKFFNFVASNQAILQTCSKCDSSLLFTNTGQQYKIEGISYTNVTAKKMNMLGLGRQIVYDLDGTFTEGYDGTTRSAATVLKNYKHLSAQADCNSPTSTALWEDTLICQPTLKIRKITFFDLQNQNQFKNTPMKIQLISNIDEDVHENSTDFSEIYSTLDGQEPMEESQFHYAAAFVADRIYSIWWQTGIDFDGLSFSAESLIDDADPAIIFKVNYTANRQLYEVADLVNGQLSSTFKNFSYNALDASTCELGDYTHNNSEQVREFTICASSRGKQQIQHSIDVDAIYCRYICPEPDGEFIKEDFVRLYSNASQWPGGTLPVAGDNVTINGNWTMLLDVDPARLSHLRIDGDLLLDDRNNPDTVIEAQSIWIKAGSLKSGQNSDPFDGTVTIRIFGNKNDAGEVYSPEVAGNKHFVVTGELHLYGKTPSTIWTRLTAFANAGATSITVGSVGGWAVGDQIVIGPSFRSATENQQVTITAISGNTVTFSPALSFNHYGASGVTIDNDYGQLDTRSAVGHISRKIKIVPGADSGWGYRLLGYGYHDTENDRVRTGHLILSGVQFLEGGQYDTEKTGLQVLNMIGTQTNTIEKSSFVDCKSICLDIKNAQNFEIKNNVFYKGRIMHMRALKLNTVQITDNLMIAATTRPTLASGKELIACIGSWNLVDRLADEVKIQNNVCQGSEGHGYAFAYIPCSKIDESPFAENTASSTPVGFIFGDDKAGECKAASGVKAYATTIGQIASSTGTKQLEFKHFMIADSGRGATLRFGLGGRKRRDMTAKLDDSFITAISRPDCADCYGAGKINCEGQSGIRMLAVTVNGENLPDKFGAGYDVICKQEQFDAKAYLTNVTFENFNKVYSEAGLSECMDNVVFKPHSIAHDMTGNHMLTKTKCNNCSKTAYGLFTPPDQGSLGWDGGCGSILCTGKNNYLVIDQDGQFFGQPGTLVANNSAVGDNTANCESIPQINGYHCNRTDLAVIEYESVAPDFNTRIMWPVYLNFEGGTYTTQTNAWRQWAWEGDQPLNLRLGRFVSIVQVNEIYNMTWTSQPPHDMVLQFQRRTPTATSDFIIVKMHYPRPNSIRIQVGGQTIKPISLLDNGGEAAIDNSTCGSNKFFYENYTIHFNILDDPNCLVRVSLTNSIQLTARFDMPINQFFNMGGETLFIDRMCAILDIQDTSRFKVVGVYSGSTIVESVIEEPTVDEANSESTNNTLLASTMTQLNQRLTELNSQGSIDENLTDAGFGRLTSFHSAVYVIPVEGDTVVVDEESGSNVALIVGIAVGVSALIAISIAGGLYCVRKRARIDQEIDDIDSEEDRNVNIEKIVPANTSENMSFNQFNEKSK